MAQITKFIAGKSFSNRRNSKLAKILYSTSRCRRPCCTHRRRQIRPFGVRRFFK